MLLELYSTLSHFWRNTFGMATFGSVLWIAYGIVISNTVILLANLIGLCLVGYIFWKKVRG